jgi:hypothetical protein
MSGGALDYAYVRVDSIVEQVEKIMTGYSGAVEYDALVDLVFFLEMSSEGLKAAEWWLSGDTDSKPLLEWRKKL